MFGVFFVHFLHVLFSELCDAPYVPDPEQNIEQVLEVLICTTYYLISIPEEAPLSKEINEVLIIIVASSCIRNLCKYY